MTPPDRQSSVPRRSFLSTLSSAAVVLPVACSSGTMQTLADESQLDAMRRRRKKASQRRRRIIFNNDADDALMFRQEGTDVSSISSGASGILKSDTVTPEAFLDIRIASIVGTQIDSMFYSDSESFGSFLHDSEVAEVFTKTVDRGDGGPSRNITKDLIAQGTDPLKLAAGFCRRNGIEFFSSVRMNDIHDGAGYMWSDAFLPQFKKDHPEYLFGEKGARLAYGRYSGVDYGQPAVRERAFLVLQDICRRYDIDGLELDFWRHPPFFKNYAVSGASASCAELDQMTELLQRVRTMTEVVSLDRDRPLLIAVRTPSSVSASRSLGLDIERWLQKNLFDILIAGEVQLSPWEECISLGHRYDVPVYPCIRPVIKSRRGVASTSESFRAMAMNIWNSGADGVYTFNMFKTRHRLYHELGDPQTLQKLDKLYRLDPVGYSMAKQYFDADRFLSLPILSPQNPWPLRAGQSTVISLPVGDDVRWGESQGLFPQVQLRVQLEQLAGSRGLSIRVNEGTLDSAVATGGWLQYHVPASLVSQGTNRIEITPGRDPAEAPILLDLELLIRYRTTK